MIKDEQAQQQLTGKTAEQTKQDIITQVTTDNAREHSGALANNFDKDKVQKEVNTQVEVTKRFDQNRQEVKAEINKKMDQAKSENQSILDKQKNKVALTTEEQEQLSAYNKKVENYQRLGVLLDVVASGLSSPTNSGLGIAASSLSPVASYEIGQYFKAKGTEGSSAHILAHTVLGAAVAAAGGNDALTAGLTAGGAEAAAPVLSNFLYGKKASDLTAEEKSTISAITGLVATGIGGAVSGDIATAVQSGQGAQNAVENNTFQLKTNNKEKQPIYPVEMQTYNRYEILVGLGYISIEQVPDEVYEGMSKYGLDNKDVTAKTYREILLENTDPSKRVYEYNSETLLGSIPSPDSVGIKKWLHLDDSVTTDDVSYRFAKHGISGLSNSELESLSKLMWDYANYRPELGDKLGSNLIAPNIKNIAIKYELLKIGINGGKLDTSLISSDTDRQKVLDDLYSGYNRLYVSNEQVQYQRDGASRLITSSTSALGVLNTGLCTAGGGDYHYCTGAGETAAALSGAFTSAFVGKAIPSQKTEPTNVTPIIKIDSNSSSALYNTKNVAVPRAGGTVELFTDVNGVKVKNAVGVGPNDPNGVGVDARSIPTIKDNSQQRVVANNPYIPDSVGGTRSIMDWLPEAARITQKDGQIIVNVTPRNPNYKSLQNLNDNELLKIGLKKTYQGELLPEFKNMRFSETGGREIPSNKVNSIIFEKVR